MPPNHRDIHRISCDSPESVHSNTREASSKHLDNEVVVLDTHKSYDLSPDVRLTPVVQSVPIWDDCTYMLETPMGTIADINGPGALRRSAGRAVTDGKGLSAPG